MPTKLVEAVFDRTFLKLDSPVDESLQDLEANIDALYYKNNAMLDKKPDKRTHAELSSSNMDDTSSCDIRESITSIKHQLQKLDLLEQMTNDVKDLKASVKFNNSLIEVLKADNASLRMEVNNLRRLTAELQKDKVNMAKDILDLQCRSMRDNIIILSDNLKMSRMKPKLFAFPESIALEGASRGPVPSLQKLSTPKWSPLSCPEVRSWKSPTTPSAISSHWRSWTDWGFSTWLWRRRGKVEGMLVCSWINSTSTANSVEIPALHIGWVGVMKTSFLNFRRSCQASSMPSLADVNTDAWRWRQLHVAMTIGDQVTTVSFSTLQTLNTYLIYLFFFH